MTTEIAADTLPVSSAPAFDPIAYEKAWRFYGALHTSAHSAYAIHQDTCDVCPALDSDGVADEDGSFCEDGLTLAQALKGARRRFQTAVSSQGRATFMGLPNGLVLVLFRDHPMEKMVDFETEQDLDWTSPGQLAHVMQTMLRYSCWGYDLIEGMTSATEPVASAVGRALQFESLAAESQQTDSPWSITESEIHAQLAEQLYHDTIDLYGLLQHDETVRLAGQAWVKLMTGSEASRKTLMTMVRSQDAALLPMLEQVSPGLEEAMAKLGRVPARRLWWALGCPFFIRPETASASQAGSSGTEGEES